MAERPRSSVYRLVNAPVQGVSTIGVRSSPYAMKKSLSMAVLLAVVVALRLAGACFSPADNYAVEVVLNKPGVSYDLSRLSGASRVRYTGGDAYAYRSHYDERLIVLLHEQEVLGGKYLGVRVQVPVEAERVTIFECKLPIPPSCDTVVRIGKKVQVAAGTGGATLDLGTISFDAPTPAVFKLSMRVDRRDVNLTVSGLLTLEGATTGAEEGGVGGRSYNISMPCLFSQGEPCYRVMMLIPGYDAPLRIEEGAYRATLALNWRASGEAVLFIEELVIGCEGRALPQPLSGWRVEGCRLVKSVGSARVAVDPKSCTCVIEVPDSAAAPPPEAERELRKLLSAMGVGAAELEYEAYTIDAKVRPAVEVGDEEVKRALEGELKWLIENGVVEGLTREDVEAIVSAARLGRAGWNGRLVWYEGSWVSYSEVPGAKLLRCVASVESVLNVESREYAELQVASARVERGGGRSTLLALTLAAALALAAAALAYAAVKRVFAQ